MLTARGGVERLASRCRWGSVPRVPDPELVPLGDGGNSPVGVLDAYVQFAVSIFLYYYIYQSTSLCRAVRWLPPPPAS